MRGIEKVAIVGAGAFGFALAVHLNRTHGGGVETRLHDADAGLLDLLASGAPHPRIDLPAGGQEDLVLPPSASIHRSPEAALDGAGLLVLAVPGRIVRRATAGLAGLLRDDLPLLNVAKALDRDTGLRMGEVVAAERGDAPYATMAGGMIASELIAGRRLGAVVAAADDGLAEEVGGVLEGPGLHVDASTDVVGVEYAGAFKNVVALGAGFLEGLGFPLGSRTLFLAEATVEVERMAVAQGGTPASFAMSSQCWGNDLVLTAFGETRNRGFGVALARALSSRGVEERAGLIEQVRQEIEASRGTVEGFHTARTIRQVEERCGVPLPKLGVIAELLAGRLDAAEAAGRMLG